MTAKPDPITKADRRKPLRWNQERWEALAAALIAADGTKTAESIAAEIGKGDAFAGYEVTPAAVTRNAELLRDQGLDVPAPKAKSWGPDIEALKAKLAPWDRSAEV